MEAWEKEIAEKNRALITGSDTERLSRYAHDLVDGLAKVKSLPEGVTIFGSARLGPNSPWYDKARDLGAKLAQNNHPVITGGGPGIMEAASRGAFENHGQSIGFNIHLATEQDLNPYTTDSMEFHYFFSRKLMMTLAAKVYVFFPGGFGTMDEFSELLELKHTGKNGNVPMFLFGSSFWRGLDKWYAGPMSDLHLIETGRVGEQDEIDPSKTGEDFIEKFIQSYSKDFRNPAADEKIEKPAGSARDLYKITDDIDEIVAVANATEPTGTMVKFRDILSSHGSSCSGR